LQIVCAQISTEIFTTQSVALKPWSVSEYGGRLHFG